MRITNYFVADPPIVDLRLGNNLNAVHIKEGDDVYFECKIKSNPREYKITWLKNVSLSFQYLTNPERTL